MPSQPEEAELSASNAWAPAGDTEAGTGATADADAPAFEAGEFYVETAPDAPASADVSVEVHAAAHAEVHQESTDTIDDAWDVPDRQATASVETPSAEPEPVVAAREEATPLVESMSASAESSTPEAVVEFTERLTDEWQTPSSSAHSSGHDELGLEVMEFVPPTSAPTSEPIADGAYDLDPLVGRTADVAATGPSATPAAFVTETMAELYLQQGFTNEALAVYRELLARSPADASLRERVAQIESGSMSSLGMATLSETVVESARKRQSARPAKSVRSFFASLAGRRAPGPQQQAAEAASVDASGAELGEPSYYAEPEPTTPDSHASSAAQTESDHSAPMTSAAETLASFDSFADAGDAGDAAMIDTTPSPNAAPTVPAEPAIAAEAPPARTTLDDLFPDTPVTPRTEAAAQTLATAFGRQEPQGRPTRAANSELSLDKVFRGSPEGSPPADGGFSFDQFFSDARQPGGDVAAPAMSPPETGRSGGGAGDAHDIEQFTAWLEGLKKK